MKITKRQLRQLIREASKKGQGWAGASEVDRMLLDRITNLGAEVKSLRQRILSLEGNEGGSGSS